MHVFVVIADTEKDDPGNRSFFIVGVYSTLSKAVEVAKEEYAQVTLGPVEDGIVYQDESVVYKLTDPDGTYEISVNKEEVD